MSNSEARNRNILAEKMEIIGQVFEIEGMSDLLNKFKTGMTTVQFNAVAIQVSGLLLKDNKELADRVIAMSAEVPDENVQGMDDAEYALALRNAIVMDVMGFFASSPRTDGKK